MTSAKPVVATILWKKSSQLLEAQAAVVEGMGYESRVMMYDAEIPAEVDIVLIQGPYGSIWPVVQQLLSRPVPQVLVYWFQQSLQWTRPEWLRRSLAHLFSDLRQQNVGRGLVSSSRPVQRILTRGRRLGFLGDMLWLHRRGLPDVLGVSSTVYADYLAAHGIDSYLVPRGSHPSYGTVRHLDRSIAAVWMGKTRTRRRRRALHWIRSELARRGLIMTLIDGSSGQFVYGNDRTDLLNRARFVVNVNFSGPTDELSIRYYIAAANGAVVITEPSLNRYDFVPGTHIVEAPIEAMPETIAYYCHHLSEWETLSANAGRLVTQTLTLERSVETLMDAALRSLHAGHRYAPQSPGIVQ